MADDFVLLLRTKDSFLRAGLEVLVREQGGRISTPEEQGVPSPCCILIDLDSAPDVSSAEDGLPEDLPAYTLSFFEDKHPTLLRPFREERFSAFLRSVRGTETDPSDRRPTFRSAERDTLFFDGKALLLEGKRIPLSEKERAVFTLLYEAEGRALGVGEIARAVWGREDAVNNVRVYIRYLRKKIASVSDRNYIKTVRDGGIFLQRERDEGPDAVLDEVSAESEE